LRPVAGLLAIAAGAAVTLPTRWALLAAATPLAVAAARFALRGGEAPPLGELALVVLLLPFLLAPRAMPWSRLLAGALLAVGGLALLPSPPALAAAAAMLALALPTGGLHATVQRTWTAVLLLLAASAAGYPWLRSEPLRGALAMLGLPTAGWRLAVGSVGLALLALLAVVVATRLERRAHDTPAAGAARPLLRRLAVAGVLAATAVALFAALPPPGRDLLRGQPVALAAGERWERRWVRPLRALRLESLLTESASLPAGTAVAVVELVRDGRVVRSLPVLVGEETAEWAADRPDLRGKVPLAPVRISWVSPSGEAFAHAYGARWELAGTRIDRVRVRRVSGGPPAATLVLRRLEAVR
jgi:hypothetical protein